MGGKKVYSDCFDLYCNTCIWAGWIQFSLKKKKQSESRWCDWHFNPTCRSVETVGTNIQNRNLGLKTLPHYQSCFKVHYVVLGKKSEDKDLFMSKQTKKSISFSWLNKSSPTLLFYPILHDCIVLHEIIMTANVLVCDLSFPLFSLSPRFRWRAMLSPTVSFSSLPLKVRNVKILHVGAVLCCSCNLHCVFWQTDGHLSSRPVLVYQSRPEKAVQNSESIAFSNDTWGHGLRNPIKFEGAVEKQRVRER